ncbi:MAG: hypothetical protein JWN15_3196 [Firmicutes bacterium]|nr:hypothetical protein [Bacillota bacterium]
MTSADDKRSVLQRLLSDRRDLLPRPARQFLDGLLKDDPLVERMRFCRAQERGQLRNSVLISTEDGCCWAVLLGNDPEAGRSASHARARLALEGLDLSPGDVLEQLRRTPIWFLAVDEAFISPPAGEAAATDRTVHRFMAMPAGAIRRAVLWDQIDAALDSGDHATCARLRALLVLTDAQM